MSSELTEEIAVKIKTDINNGGRIKDIVERYGIPQTAAYAINSGIRFSKVQPLTPKQIKAEESRLKRLQFLKDNPYPKEIRLTIIDADHESMIMMAIEEYRNNLRQTMKEHEIEVAKITLLIDAIERNDYSDVPPSAMAEFEKLRAELKEHGTIDGVPKENYKSIPDK